MSGPFLLSLLIWGGCILGLLSAAVTDMRARRIPNRIVIAILTGGLALRLIAAPALIGISLAVAAAVFGALAALSHFRLLGEGDTKLIAASTLLVPADAVLSLLLAIAVAGGVLSLLYLAARIALTALPWHRPGRLPRGGTAFFRREAARINHAGSLPYAVAILGGVGFHALNEACHAFA